jgi:hypothetical protein
MRSPDRKPRNMDIAGVKSRQLTPTVVTIGSGSTGSPALRHLHTHLVNASVTFFINKQRQIACASSRISSSTCRRHLQFRDAEPSDGPSRFQRSTAASSHAHLGEIMVADSISYGAQCQNPVTTAANSEAVRQARSNQERGCIHRPVAAHKHGCQLHNLLFLSLIDY